MSGMDDLWHVAALAGLCAGLLAAALLAPAQAQACPPAAGIPTWMRLAWPWVRALSRPVRPLLTWRGRQRLEQLLAHAGLQKQLLPDDIVAAQAALAMLSAAGCVLVGHAWLGVAPAAAVAVPAAALAAVLPRAWLSDQARTRARRIARELPFVLDMATLCIEAGLNLQGALQQAAQRGPDGPMREELQFALADMRAGLPRLQALQAMAARAGVPALRTMVATLAQAEALGMGLGPVLRTQAHSQRNERFLRAERLALEAPVKMLLPLVACIFPCTFLIIGFPIAVRLMAYAQ